MRRKNLLNFLKFLKGGVYMSEKKIAIAETIEGEELENTAFTKIVKALEEIGIFVYDSPSSSLESHWKLIFSTVVLCEEELEEIDPECTSGKIMIDMIETWARSVRHNSSEYKKIIKIKEIIEENV
jgi:hypothetical protein